MSDSPSALRTCPNCRGTDVKRIPMPIASHDVVYLRCAVCAHIWTVNTRTGEKIVDVTPARKDL